MMNHVNGAIKTQAYQTAAAAVSMIGLLVTVQS